MIGAVLGTLGGAEARQPPGSRATAGRTGRSPSEKTSSPSVADSSSRSSSASSERRTVAEKFDAIIVGAGQAGPPLAGRLTRAGQTVAVIERKLVGGTCVNYGCIPTKTLVASAHAAHLARRGAEYGVGTGEITVDMAKVKARKDKIMLDDRQRRRVVAGGHGRVHVHPRPRPLRGSAHDHASTDGCWRPTRSSSTSVAVRWRPTCRDCPTSTT